MLNFVVLSTYLFQCEDDLSKNVATDRLAELLIDLIDQWTSAPFS